MAGTAGWRARRRRAFPVGMQGGECAGCARSQGIAPTLARPRWGREPAVPDGVRWREWVQGCDTPLVAGTVGWRARWRRALPGRLLTTMGANNRRVRVMVGSVLYWTPALQFSSSLTCRQIVTDGQTRGTWPTCMSSLWSARKPLRFAPDP